MGHSAHPAAASPRTTHRAWRASTRGERGLASTPLQRMLAACSCRARRPPTPLQASKAVAFLRSTAGQQAVRSAERSRKVQEAPGSVPLVALARAIGATLWGMTRRLLRKKRPGAEEWQEEAPGSTRLEGTSPLGRARRRRCPRRPWETRGMPMLALVRPLGTLQRAALGCLGRRQEPGLTQRAAWDHWACSATMAGRGELRLKVSRTLAGKEPRRSSPQTGLVLCMPAEATLRRLRTGRQHQVPRPAGVLWALTPLAVRPKGRDPGGGAWRAMEPTQAPRPPAAALVQQERPREPRLGSTPSGPPTQPARAPPQAS
mmetsp:Transcript_3179/g.7463  ORF Transcript_3179/g.7463 Transcript_3179/m.7463 type:complete len:317 (+) Transcript_3179:419-1369(+)